MFRIDDATAALALPTPEAAGTEGYFTEGSAGVTPATIVRASWLNRLQENLRGLLVAAGITPAKTDYTQVLGAVKRLAFAGVVTKTANATLTLDEAGLVLVSASGGNVTLTLPAANGMTSLPIRYVFVRTDATANTVTISRAGSDLIEGATSIALLPNERVKLASDGSANWRATADGRFGASLGASGWQKFPNGLILQWGVTANGNIGAGAPTTFTGTLPLTFPTGCDRIIGSLFNSGTAGTQEAASITDIRCTTTTVTAYIEEFVAVPQTVGCTYLAIGR